ncbi:MAG: AAA family ATPase [Methanomassiliicoccaceae archaeon]|nr:AAA family ATPase [Methanomassiliicoccaceae archaeon]
MDFDKRLQTLVEANTPVIQIISYETLRVHASLMKVSKNTSLEPYIWNLTEGLRRYENKKIRIIDAEMGPGDVLDWYADPDNKKMILLLEDFHPFITKENPKIISRIRNISRKISLGELKERVLIISQPAPHLPIELEKDVQILHLPLPEREQIRDIMSTVKDQFGLDDRNYDESQRLIDAALGLSTSEAWSAYACAVVERKMLTEEEIPLVSAEKEQVIRKRGNLEYYQPQQNLSDIGGLNRLKDWLKRREKAFTQDAQNFGLEPPRGIMLLGLPGTGKSLAAKAVANAWKLPLLRLDMGRVFGGIVGQSEENMRSALNVAETLAPCILWIDEIEKGMSGMQSSGATDGGTTARVLGTFLTWMQEKKKPVFVVATANNIAQLPPELLRKGRVDEIFFVDLPDQMDRKEIIEIHLKKRKRKAFSNKDMEKLANISKGYTGAELEEAIKEAMYRAFDKGHDIGPSDVEGAIRDTTPLSKTMSEVIKQTREWANGRAVLASDREPEELIMNEEKTVRLPQESYNPFVKD